MAGSELTADPRWADAALVLCAHGIRGAPGTAIQHARLIGRLGVFADVRACAHKGDPGLVETLTRLTARRTYLLPLLMAEGYTLRAMLRKLDAVPSETRPVVCRPVGVHQHFARMIAGSAEAICAARGWAPEATSLLIAGHGTHRARDSGATARRHAAAVAATGTFGEVVVAFLDEPPTIPDVLRSLRHRRCVAVGLFVDRGEHGEEDMPGLLAAAGSQAAYAGPVGTEPAVAELILDQVREADAGEAALRSATRR